MTAMNLVAEAHFAYKRRLGTSPQFLVLDRRGLEIIGTEMLADVHRGGREVRPQEILGMQVLGMQVVGVPGEIGRFTLVGPPQEFLLSPGIAESAWHDFEARITTETQVAALDALVEEIRRAWPITPMQYKAMPMGIGALDFAIRHVTQVHVGKDLGKLNVIFDWADHTGREYGTAEHTIIERVARNLLLCSLRLYALMGRSGTEITEAIERWKHETDEEARPRHDGPAHRP